MPAIDVDVAIDADVPPGVADPKFMVGGGTPRDLDDDDAVEERTGGGYATAMNAIDAIAMNANDATIANAHAKDANDATTTVMRLVDGGMRRLSLLEAALALASLGGVNNGDVGGGGTRVHKAGGRRRSRMNAEGMEGGMEEGMEMEMEEEEGEVGHGKVLPQKGEGEGSGSGIAMEEDVDVDVDCDGGGTSGNARRAKTTTNTTLSSHDRLSFPRRLMLALSDPTVHPDALAWLTDARGFVIRDKRSLFDAVMPKYFGDRSSGVSKYTSFTRKLNRWGYVRVLRGRDMGAYYHERFRRDMDESELAGMRPTRHEGGGRGGGTTTAEVRRGA